MLTKKYVYVMVWLSFYEVKTLPLFEQFPELTTKIPHVPLAHLPTPIHACDQLKEILHHPIFIKRDDLTGYGNCYGGNKVRKLEFLLGDALHQGARTIITYGSAGTNHGLATACYSSQLGLGCILMLKHQPNSSVVRQNLLLDSYFNAEFNVFKNDEERDAALEVLLDHDKSAYFIPTGGSTPLGAIGYVNAACELQDQIQQGVLPEPDVIYLPIGSCGTTAGLLLGFTIARIKSKIIAVAVEPEETCGAFLEKTKTLFFQTNALLHSLSGKIPIYEFPYEQLCTNKEFCGNEYGGWMQDVDDAKMVMKTAQGIQLEGTYSAKAFAALFKDIGDNCYKNSETVLLWNTYCGLDFAEILSQVSHKKLPIELHSYFEEIPGY